MTGVGLVAGYTHTTHVHTHPTSSYPGKNNVLTLGSLPVRIPAIDSFRLSMNNLVTFFILSLRIHLCAKADSERFITQHFYFFSAQSLQHGSN